MYAVRHINESNSHATEVEIRKFFGLLLISGYLSLPSENDYWSTCDGLIALVFGKTMSRERFRTIKRYLHLADNSSFVNGQWVACT